MKRIDQKLKICLAASAGGHMSQLLNIVNNLNCHDSFYITTSDVMRDKLGECSEVYVVGECNREHLFKVIAVSFQCMKVILRENPNVVISTGAAVGCIVCFISKIIGAKIIWVDSITNVDRLSLSGRMVKNISDLFLVQWPDLVKKYENVEYAGALV